MNLEEIKMFREKGLPLIQGETCSLFKHVYLQKGVCDLDQNIVDINASCKQPQECYKLKQRQIKVIEI